MVQYTELCSIYTILKYGTLNYMQITQFLKQLSNAKIKILEGYNL